MPQLPTMALPVTPVIDITTGQVGTSDTLKGRNVKPLLLRAGAPKPVDQFTASDYISEANAVRLQGLRFQAKALIEELYSTQDQLQIQHMRDILQKRLNNAVAGNKPAIQTVIDKVDALNDWVRTVYKRLATAYNVVNARVTLADAYSDQRLNTDALRALFPTEDALGLIAEIESKLPTLN